MRIMIINKNKKEIYIMEKVKQKLKNNNNNNNQINTFLIRLNQLLIIAKNN